jgi:nitrogen fixation NifU-like protein
MAYSEKVIDHYENPRNVGGFDAGDDVATGMVGAPACGDVMKLQIKVNPSTGVIEDARFKTYGCGSAIASSSLVTEWVKGKTLDQALAIKNTAIAEELGLAGAMGVAITLGEGSPALPAPIRDPLGGSLSRTIKGKAPVVPIAATARPESRKCRRRMAERKFGAVRDRVPQFRQRRGL